MSDALVLARPGGKVSIEARADGLYAVPADPGVCLRRADDWPAGRSVGMGDYEVQT